MLPFRNEKFPNSVHLPAGCLEDKDLPAPRLNCLSQSTFKHVCVLHRGPPWGSTIAKLNLYSPSLCSWKGPVLTANTACERQPSGQGSFQNHGSPKPSAIALLLSTHPLLTGWRRLGGAVKRAVSTLHPRYCNLTASFVLNSALTPVVKESMCQITQPSWIYHRI